MKCLCIARRTFFKDFIDRFSFVTVFLSDGFLEGGEVYLKLDCFRFLLDLLLVLGFKLPPFLGTANEREGC